MVFGQPVVGQGPSTVTTAPMPGRIAVIGLGYVGLPLAVAFGRVTPTIGFDINEERVRNLQQGIDQNGELDDDGLIATQLSFTADEADLEAADFFIIAVPTPVDRAKRPDLSALIGASRTVGRVLKGRSGRVQSPAIVVYESTVYPGCTEDVCRPVLEASSDLTAGRDFKLGYSPERINPGDREHTLAKVVKVVSAQDAETLDMVARTYCLVAKAGVHRAPTIRTAEAAKVIENVQRDLNIALMNELSTLFHRLGIDTHEVLEAAKTKWNFLPFEPGLVGGHCIPEDPYYLTHKAQEVGFHPEIILAGRRINDSMGHYVAQETLRLLIQTRKAVHEARVLLLGITFKENVKDTRNSRAIEVARELEAAGVTVDVYDPAVGEEGVSRLGLRAIADPFSKTLGSGAKYDALVLAVPHTRLTSRPFEAFLQLASRSEAPGIIVDVKAALRDSAREFPSDLVYWTL